MASVALATSSQGQPRGGAAADLDAAVPVGLGFASTEAQAASPAAHYERIESNIGEGTYGKVHKARDVRTGRIVAIKKTKASAGDQDVGGIGFTAIREIKLMQAVKDPNVIGCLDVFADGGSIHLVLEFMDGDLKKVIDDRSIHMSEAHVKCLSQQLLQGINALHQCWFVHRDVTPTNVLLNFSTGVAKLSDFGFTRSIGNGDRPLTPMCTTLWYRAPELLFGAKFYGQSVDIWSAGCVVAELFLRQVFFRGRGEFDMLTKVFEKRGTPTEEVWRDVSALPSFLEFSYHPKVAMSLLLPSASASAQEFLDACLTLDPKLRPTAESALRHQCFAADSRPPPCAAADLPFVRR